MKFFTAERRFALPEHSGISWQEIYERETDNVELAMWFDSEDGLVQQCDERNTDIYMSHLDDDSDAILVLDSRDDQRYAMFRSEFQDKAFNKITKVLQQLGGAALHMSVTPNPTIYGLWLNRMHADLSRIDTVPEDWVSETE